VFTTNVYTQCNPIYQTNIEIYDFYNSYYNLKIGYMWMGSKFCWHGLVIFVSKKKFIYMLPYCEYQK